MEQQLEIFLKKKLRAKIMNEISKKNFGQVLEKLENDPALLRIERYYDEYKALSVASNDPRIILMASFLDQFHNQFEINKKILRDCMEIDWEEETAELQMNSMKRCSEASMNKLYSLLEEFKEVMI